MTSDDPIIHRATDQFVAYLLATRDEWVEGEIRQAIGAATNLGRSWAWVTTTLLRIALDGGSPLDLCPVPVAHALVEAAGPNPEYLETKKTLIGEHRRAEPARALSDPVKPYMPLPTPTPTSKESE